MEKTGVTALAKVLRVLVSIVFLCNLIVLLLIPGLTMLHNIGQELRAGIALFQEEGIWWLTLQFFSFFLSSWGEVWMFGTVYQVILAAFLLLCGACTAVILWQAQGVLGTIVKEDTFTFQNARRMTRAAVCCFLIAAAALARTIWGLVFFHSIQPLFTYNALFCPIFLMGGLLCMVMSALFRQAAELKVENDLTI